MQPKLWSWAFVTGQAGCTFTDYTKLRCCFELLDWCVALLRLAAPDAFRSGHSHAHFTGYAFNFGALSGNITWRCPILLQCFFVVAIYALATTLPDTPRWYLARGCAEEARTVTARLFDCGKDDAKVCKQLSQIEQALRHEAEAAANAGFWIHLLSPGQGGRDDSIRSRRRWLLACFIQAAQQLGGINALIYYSPTLFRVSVALDKRRAALLAGGLNAVLIAGSSISVLLIDRIGRRPLLLSCVGAMSAVFAVQAGLVWRIEKGTAPADVSIAAIAMREYRSSSVNRLGLVADAEIL